MYCINDNRPVYTPVFHGAGTYPSKPTCVSTILSPIERVNVDVISRGAFVTLHRDTVDEVIYDLRKGRSKAFIVSASSYNSRNNAKIAEVVREFPRTPMFALLTRERWTTPLSTHCLGQLGIKTLVDVRSGEGWNQLRKMLVRERSNDVQRIALDMISLDLGGCTEDCWKFFDLLFTHYPYVCSVRQMAHLLNVLPPTLLSRFYRSNLPSPKEYIDIARLTRAARLLENKGLSVCRVSDRLNYSSPQAFSRHTKGVLKMSPVEFRQNFTGESMIDYFRERLVLPYVDTLRTFQPVFIEPAWLLCGNKNGVLTS